MLLIVLLQSPHLCLNQVNWEKAAGTPMTNNPQLCLSEVFLTVIKAGGSMTVSPLVSPKVLDKLQGNLSSHRLLQILIKPIKC